MSVLSVTGWAGTRKALGITVLLNLVAGVLVASVGGDYFSAAKGPPKGFVVRQGSQLMLDGKPFRFTGANAYQLATNYQVNIGCGPQPTSPAELIDTLPAGSVVRFWAFQPMAVNVLTRRRDWSVLDKVVATAAARGVKLVMTLSDQSGTCDDGHWHDLAWYQGAYRQIFDDNGKHAELTSWWDWMHEIVTRYANSPAIAYWEPVNEPETSNCDAGFTGVGCYGHDSCPGGNAEVLRDFFTTIGAAIHEIDRWHGVASGTLAQGECGSVDPYFALVGRSPGLDILTVHDYDPRPHTASDFRIQQAAQVGKPLIYEEVGEDASPTGGGCPTTSQRAATLALKLKTAFASPVVAGFLPWQWLGQEANTCATAYSPTDPLLPALENAVRDAPVPSRSSASASHG